MAPQTPQPHPQALAAAIPCAQRCSSPQSSAQGEAVLPMALCCHQGWGVPAEWGHLLRAKTTAPGSTSQILLVQSGKAAALPAHPSPCHHTLALSQPIPTQTQAGLSPPSLTGGGGTGRALGSPPGPPAPSSPAAPALHTPSVSDGRTGKMLLLRSCYLDVSPQAEPGQGDYTHVCHSHAVLLEGHRAGPWACQPSRAPSPQTP